MGIGPMTGRGHGDCAGHGAPGFVNRMSGQGFVGSGRNGGRSWRNMLYVTGLPGWAWMGVDVTGVNPAAGALHSTTRDQEFDVLKQQGD
jgi:hypothetical protein